MDKKLTTQLWLAVGVVIAGLSLLFIGIFTPPGGVIDSSVLVAFGEVATFAGSLLGLDYHYKYKEYMERTNKSE